MLCSSTVGLEDEEASRGDMQLLVRFFGAAFILEGALGTRRTGCARALAGRSTGASMQADALGSGSGSVTHGPAPSASPSSRAVG